MVLIVIYRFLAIRENKKRDAAGILEGFDHAYEDDVTDKKVKTIFASKASMKANFYLRIRNSDTHTKRHADILSDYRSGQSVLRQIRYT
jgi:hypothetical protein